MQAFHQLENFEAAISEHSCAVQTGYSPYLSHINISRANERLSNWEQALHHAQEALKIATLSEGNSHYY